MKVEYFNTNNNSTAVELGEDAILHKQPAKAWSKEVPGSIPEIIPFQSDSESTTDTKSNRLHIGARGVLHVGERAVGSLVGRMPYGQRANELVGDAFTASKATVKLGQDAIDVALNTVKSIDRVSNYVTDIAQDIVDAGVEGSGSHVLKETGLGKMIDSMQKAGLQISVNGMETAKERDMPRWRRAIGFGSIAVGGIMGAASLMPFAGKLARDPKGTLRELLEDTAKAGLEAMQKEAGNQLEDVISDVDGYVNRLAA